MIPVDVILSKQSLRWRVIRYWGERVGRSSEKNYGIETDCDLRDVILFELPKFLVFNRYAGLWFLWPPLVLAFGMYAFFLSKADTATFMYGITYCVLMTAVGAYFAQDISESKLTQLGFFVCAPLLLPLGLVIALVVQGGALIFGKMGLLSKKFVSGRAVKTFMSLIRRLMEIACAVCVSAVFVLSYIYERAFFWDILTGVLTLLLGAVLVTVFVVVVFFSTRVVASANHNAGQRLINRHGMPNPPGRKVEADEITLFRYFFLRVKERVCRRIRFVD